MSSTIEELSQPLSDESPSGENLEYDADFLQLVDLYEAKAKAGASVSDDDLEEEPDWRLIDKLTEGLLERTRDMRVAIYSAIAALHFRDLPAFRDRLTLLRNYLRDHWDTVHPQLDPDDNFDPLFRQNTLELFRNSARVARVFEYLQLVELQGIGKIGVREVDLAQGQSAPAKNEEPLDVNLIRQAFVREDPEKVAGLRTAVADSLALLKDIDAVWVEKTDDAVGPGFPVLTEGLTRVQSIIDEFAPGDDPATAQAGGEEAPAAVPGIEAAVPGAVKSRADVIRLLDRICEYYAENEPSSPSPLLLRRAQSLVEKSFMEILEDMAPDGVQQAKIVGGGED